jgi:hypothetical protein
MWRTGGSWDGHKGAGIIQKKLGRLDLLGEFWEGWGGKELLKERLSGWGVNRKIGSKNRHGARGARRKKRKGEMGKGEGTRRDEKWEVGFI